MVVGSATSKVNSPVTSSAEKSTPLQREDSFTVHNAAATHKSPQQALPFNLSSLKPLAYWATAVVGGTLLIGGLVFGAWLPCVVGAASWVGVVIAILMDKDRLQKVSPEIEIKKMPTAFKGKAYKKYSHEINALIECLNEDKVKLTEIKSAIEAFNTQARHSSDTMRTDNLRIKINTLAELFYSDSKNPYRAKLRNVIGQDNNTKALHQECTERLQSIDRDLKRIAAQWDLA
jgi:hypothetical protein